MSGKSYVLDAQGTPHLVKKRFYVDAEGNVRPIKKSESGGKNVYSSSHFVAYHVNTDDIRLVEIDDGADAITGAPDVSNKFSGWSFVGWREDTVAASEVEQSYPVVEDGVHLYAVYTQNITITYNANGGSSTPAAVTKPRYYNNTSVTNPTFTLAAAISRGNSVDASGNEYSYAFASWGGYAAGSSLTLDHSWTATAQWTPTYIRRWLVRNGQIMSGVGLIKTQVSSGAAQLTSGNGYVSSGTMSYNNRQIVCNIAPAIHYPNKTFYLQTSWSGQFYTAPSVTAMSGYSGGFQDDTYACEIPTSSGGGWISFAANSVRGTGKNTQADCIYLGIASGFYNNGSTGYLYIYNLYVQ